MRKHNQWEKPEQKAFTAVLKVLSDQQALVRGTA